MHSHKDGGVAEWLKALAWKAGVRLKPYREFESHPLRQYLIYISIISISYTLLLMFIPQIVPQIKAG
jgi:hypothetical protein